MVLWAINNSLGGEIFVPKSILQITDIAKAICPDCQQNIIGIRPEKNYTRDDNKGR